MKEKELVGAARKKGVQRVSSYTVFTMFQAL